MAIFYAVDAGGPSLELVDLGSGTPGVGFTVTGVPAGSRVTVWRTVEGRRSVVRGWRDRVVEAADYGTDFEVALGRPTRYTVEFGDGTVIDGGITVDSPTGWVQDPLVPASALPVSGTRTADGSPYVTASAFTELAYRSRVDLLEVLGADAPVAIMGQRMTAAGVDFSMMTTAFDQTAQLRDLLVSTPLLLVRTHPDWGDLPALCYLAADTITEQRLTVALGGSLTRRAMGLPEHTQWDAQGTTVRPPALNLIAPVVTWGFVESMWSTWAEWEASHQGQTWLDVLRTGGR